MINDALVAQMVEHGTFNAGVMGSSPIGRTKHKQILCVYQMFLGDMHRISI